MTGKHKAKRLNPLPKRDPGKAGNAERAVAQDTASKGGGKIVRVDVKGARKH